MTLWSRSLKIRQIGIVMKRKFLALLACLVIGLFAMPVSTAHASSQYDNVVSSVNSVVVKEGMSSCTIDVTLTWASDIRSFLNPTQLASFDDKVAWGVSLKEIPGDVFVADVYWWDSQDLPATATFDGNTLKTTPAHTGTLLVWHNGVACQMDGYGSSSMSEATVAEYDPDTLTHPMRPFLLYGANISYPTGYEGEQIASSYTPPPATYVAMGDSFSSGEGNPPFEAGTDTSSDKCHRSSEAYPRLLQADSSLSLGTTSFVACSGATTNDVLNGKDGESSQLDALSENTETVTITVGGNDVGFSDYIQLCFAGSCGKGTSAYASMMSGIDDPYFELDLKATYLEILQNAPAAQVYVVDYPYLTAADATSCGLFDFSGGRSVQTELNGVIHDAVDAVASTDARIHYVNTNVAGSPFEGQYYCNGGTTDFNGLDSSHIEYSFHPNTQGQHDYATIVKGVIEDNS